MKKQGSACTTDSSYWALPMPRPEQPLTSVEVVAWEGGVSGSAWSLGFEAHPHPPTLHN